MIVASGSIVISPSLLGNKFVVCSSQVTFWVVLLDWRNLFDTIYLKGILLFCYLQSRFLGAMPVSNGRDFVSLLLHNLAAQEQI